MPRQSVAVVIPAYNSEACLRQTIESILAQTRPPDEILIVNDGSTDSTEQVARSFGSAIRYLEQANQGIAAARNTGIAAATSDWIAPFDHDDLMLPEKLEKQMSVAEANPSLAVVYTGFSYWYKDGTQVPAPAFPARKLWPALRYRTPILPSTSIIRRSALHEVGGFRPLYCVDDWDIWFRLVHRYSTKAFQEIAEPLTLYRRWDLNVSRNVMPMAEAALYLTDTLLLDDLTGLSRNLWQRRAEARQYYELALELRERQDPRYWAYAVESFLRWPLCGKIVRPARYRVLAHMLYTRLKNFRADRLYWWPERRCREELASRSLR